MFLPIGDIPNPRTTPWATYALMAINIAVFVLVTVPLSLARPDLNDPLLLDYLNALNLHGDWPIQSVLDQVSAYDLTVFRYGYRPAQGSFLTLFTAMFMHAGWLHLAGNMLFLYIFGDNVEHRMGRGRYLLGYLGAGIAATLFFALFVPGSQVPLIGASGAISGVLGFYFVWFPRNQVKVFVFLFPLLMTHVLIPARLVLGFYLLIDNLLPFLLAGSGGGGVAHGAHIGGFLAGMGLAAASDHLPGLLKPKGPRIPRARADLVDVVTDIVRALERGELPHAAARYLALESRLQRSQLATGNILAIGRFLLENGHSDQALTLFRRVIAERPGDAALDQAYLGAGQAMLQKQRCDTAAWHYFLTAVDLARTPEVTEAARRGLKVIEGCVQEGE
ncbi:MAG: rhomboid family intramembrane serine protease [Desulfuromonas sp.]|nr:rhomboid family intramembrane serine protease [Desulfuromonas sp.]